MKKTLAMGLCGIALVACSPSEPLAASPASTSHEQSSGSSSTASPASRSEHESAASKTPSSETSSEMTTTSSGELTESTAPSPHEVVQGQDEATAEAFAREFVANDPAALSRIAAGSPAYVYADGTLQLYKSSPPPPGTEVKKVANGWATSNGVELTDFKFDNSGLIISFSRNGSPIDAYLVPGGIDPIVVGDVVVTVHSFRRWPDEPGVPASLQIIASISNNGPDNVWVFFDAYVNGGTQLPVVSSAGGDIYPGVTRFDLFWSDSAAAGGVLHGVIGSGTSSEDFSIQVPTFG